MFVSNYRDPVCNSLNEHKRFHEKIQEVNLPVQGEKVPQQKAPLAWKIMGYVPFNSIYTLSDFAKETEEQQQDFGNDIFGVFLPYSGLDTGPTTFRENKKYLHLFNVGRSIQLITATVGNVEFKYVEVHPTKKTILQLR